MKSRAAETLTLIPGDYVGALEPQPNPAPLENARWYTARDVGDGLLYTFPKGALTAACYLTADLLLDGKNLAVFVLKLHEGENGPTFKLIFGLLAQCSARLRLPVEATRQNRWRYPREGAWLKVMCAGERVDVCKVDRITLSVLRKGDENVRWCLTPLRVTTEAPPLITKPLLPKGPLLDALGQSTLHDWPEKSRSREEVTKRLRAQLEAAPTHRPPERFSHWGGFMGERFEATGFFRTHHDGRRWWLVDPDGHAFWSAGQNRVAPSIGTAFEGLEDALSWPPEPDHCFGTGQDGQRTVDYLVANLTRAFGKDWHERWAEVALSQLRRMGFNTVANWSDWRVAKAAGFPYVRPLQPTFQNTPKIFRDFPDVFHPNFAQDAAAFAEALLETADDPAFIGYFLMNEPTWGFASETPAEGMLFNTAECATRRGARRLFAGALRGRHGLGARLGRGGQARGGRPRLVDLTPYRNR